MAASFITTEKSPLLLSAETPNEAGRDVSESKHGEEESSSTLLSSLSDNAVAEVNYIDKKITLKNKDSLYSPLKNNSTPITLTNQEIEDNRNPCLLVTENEQSAAESCKNHIITKLRFPEPPHNFGSTPNKAIIVICVIFSVLIVAYISISILSSLNVIHIPGLNQQKFTEILAFAGCSLVGITSLSMTMIAFIIGKNSGERKSYSDCAEKYSRWCEDSMLSMTNRINKNEIIISDKEYPNPC